MSGRADYADSPYASPNSPSRPGSGVRPGLNRSPSKTRSSPSGSMGSTGSGGLLSGLPSPPRVAAGGPNSAAAVMAASRPGSAVGRPSSASSMDRSMLPGHRGMGDPKAPLSQRLAQTKAAYSAAATNRTVDNLLKAGAKPDSPALLATMERAQAERQSAAAARKEGGRPTGFICYLCGAQFGSTSLHIHVAACQRKWVAVEEGKPARERRPLPDPPPEMESGMPLPSGGADLDDFNASMFKYYDQISLMACGNCGRTFRPDALERHAKVCTADAPARPPPGKAGPSPSAPSPKPSTPSGRPPGGGIGGGRGPGSGPGGGPNMNSKPRGYTCYLCGQQYGSKSLYIHIGNCQKKWVAVEDAKLPRERRKLPPPPPEIASGELPLDGPGVDEFNMAMTNYWSKCSLIGCPICTRTFRPEAYEHHRTVCTKDNPGGPLGMPKGVAPPGTSGGKAAPGMGGAGGRTKPVTAGNTGNYDHRPRAYMCYLCGSQYGSSSLGIHVPQCYEKWLKVEAAKPPRERREPPPPPSELDGALPTASDDVDAFNQRMSDIFNGVSLMPCAHCGRTMRSDALVRHQKMCTAEKPMGRVAAGSGTAGGPPPGSSNTSGSNSAAYAAGEQEEEEGEKEECAHCGRKMRPDALMKHNRLCTADKPMKRLPATSSSSKPSLTTPASQPSPPSSNPPSTAGSPRRPPPRTSASASSSTPTSPTAASGSGSNAAQLLPPSPSTPPAVRAMSRLGGAGSGAAALAESLDAEGEEDTTAPNRQRGGAMAGPPEYVEDGPGGDDGRVQCEGCGRRFNPEAFDKHAAICAKVFQSKRKAYNSTSARVAGTEAATFVKKVGKAGGGSSRPAGASSTATGGGGDEPAWKAQSNALRQAMQGQRQVAAAIARGEDVRNIPVVYSGPDPSFIQCPTCTRYFAPKAADRHIPACHGNGPKFLKAGTGGAGQGAPEAKALPNHSRRR